MGIDWHLRLKMAERGMYHTSDLVPLLAERKVELSREQVSRLVTQPACSQGREVRHRPAAGAPLHDPPPGQLVKASAALAADREAVAAYLRGCSRLATGSLAQPSGRDAVPGLGFRYAFNRRHRGGVRGAGRRPGPVLRH
jgi:hypothetical protein